MPTWIKVSDKLPILNDIVLVTDGEVMYIARWLPHSKCWQQPGLDDPLEHISHWVPLPELPK